MNVVRNHATLALQAHVDELRRAAGWLHAEAGARAVPDEAIGRLDLCLHEALANILDHSGLAADATLQLALQLQPGSATLTLVDSGHPYDPTMAPAPARPTTLADTLPGGLGVVMLRSQADQLAYEHRDGSNQLQITVRWGEAA